VSIEEKYKRKGTVYFQNNLVTKSFPFYFKKLEEKEAVINATKNNERLKRKQQMV
jgi:hypothetical protein